MKTPKQIKNLSANWNNAAWKTYTPGELVLWVENLSKRAENRTPDQTIKIKKDITDASNYLAMLKAHMKDMGLTDAPSERDIERAKALSSMQKANLVEKTISDIHTAFATASDKRQLVAVIGALDTRVQSAKLSNPINKTSPRKRSFFSNWF